MGALKLDAEGQIVATMPGLESKYKLHIIAAAFLED